MGEAVGVGGWSDAGSGGRRKEDRITGRDDRREAGVGV